MERAARSRLWILVTDGHRARIVVPDPAEGTFRTKLPLGVCAYPYCPPPLRSAIVHRHFGQFAADVAERLNQAAGDEFDGLVLVAPIMVAEEIRGLLAPATLARLTGTVDRDFAALDDRALSRHLGQWWTAPVGAIETADQCAPGAMTG